MSDIWDIHPPSSRPGTSEDAAQAIEPVSGTLRRAVYELIRDAGEHGATDEEISERLGLDSSTTRPRRWELERAAWVRDSGRRRRTRGGRDAIVWVAGSQTT